MDPLPNELLEQMLAPTRRALAAGERELLDRIVASGSSAAAHAVGRAGAAAGAIPGDVTAALFRLLTLINKLPHAAAEALLDTDRGWFGVRALTAGETAAVHAAWGGRLETRPIRIVAGEGLSLIASCAFLNGNPAITVGNTIYVKPAASYRWLTSP